MVTIAPFLPIGNLLKKSIPAYVGTVCIGPGGDNAETNTIGLSTLLAAKHEADLPKVLADDIALVPYSSGTSGLPKGVLLTHKNCVANLQQLTHPDVNRQLHPNIMGGYETVLTIPPFFHIYGLNGALNLCLKDGHHVVSIPKFTPEDYFKALINYKPEVLFVVPSLLLFLATHPNVKKEWLQSIKQVIVGAAAATKQIQENFRRKCDKDIIILHGYGMTESSPVTLLSPLFSLAGKEASVGNLLPNTEARIVDLGDGKILGPDQPGEIQFKGPQVMVGYLNNVEATKEAITEDGWLRTGDVAYFDKDKYFYIVDRTKELIKVKGNQVNFVILFFFC